MKLYFDNAATTLNKPPGVAEAVSDAIIRMGNPGRSGHASAMLAADAVYRCRELASDLFDVLPERVIFTMNATHALNIAIRSLVPYQGKVVLSGFEHNAVTRMLYALQADALVANHRLFDTQDTIHCFDKAIRTDVDAVIVNHVSNVFGYVQPLEEIAAICRDRGVPLIVDAAQSAGVLPISLEKLQAAFIAMPGHKALFGPQGTGMLLCGVMPKPLLFGGTGNLSMQQSMPDMMPEGLEAGTLNVPGICGLAEGMKFVQSVGVDKISEHERALSSYFCNQMNRIEACRVFRGEKETQLGVVSADFLNCDCENIAGFLAEMGVSVRSGLHCAPLAHRSAGTEKSGTVRFSFSALNTEKEIDSLMSLLERKKDDLSHGKL